MTRRGGYLPAGKAARANMADLLSQKSAELKIQDEN